MRIIKHFNSIKVQLEHASANASYLKQLFQFHKGTIRTRLSSRCFIVEVKFQFHKGTIRTVQLSSLFAALRISIP